MALLSLDRACRGAERRAQGWIAGKRHCHARMATDSTSYIGSFFCFVLISDLFLIQPQVKKIADGLLIQGIVLSKQALVLFEG